MTEQHERELVELRKQDVIHWKTRRTLLRRIDALERELRRTKPNGGMDLTCPNCGHEPCAEWCGSDRRPSHQEGVKP